MSEDICIVPFDIKYLDDYYNGFNTEITKYQWPDPFNHVEDARALLLEFLDEMQTGETLLYSVLSQEGAFLGSVEVHGLSEDCPELFRQPAVLVVMRKMLPVLSLSCIVRDVPGTGLIMSSLSLTIPEYTATLNQPVLRRSQRLYANVRSMPSWLA